MGREGEKRKNCTVTRRKKEKTNASQKLSSCYLRHLHHEFRHLRVQVSQANVPGVDDAHDAAVAVASGLGGVSGPRGGVHGIHERELRSRQVARAADVALGGGQNIRAAARVGDSGEPGLSSGELLGDGGLCFFFFF